MKRWTAIATRITPALLLAFGSTASAAAVSGRAASATGNPSMTLSGAPGAYSPQTAPDAPRGAAAPSLIGGVITGLSPLPEPGAAPLGEARSAPSVIPRAAPLRPAPTPANDDLSLPATRPTATKRIVEQRRAASRENPAFESPPPNAPATDALAQMGVLFDGSERRPNPANAADPVRANDSGALRGNAADELRRVQSWRLSDDAFDRQASVELLIDSLGLDPHHRNWLTDIIFGDRLTGLKNALYLREKQEEIVVGSKAIITIKLDWLKEINDGVSHAAGDAFLKGFGVIGRKIVGAEGVVIRRSPTGFAVFVKGSTEKARLIAEAVRLGVERELSSDRALASDIKSKEPVRTTISAGVAELVKDAMENGADNGGMTYAKAYRRAEEARTKAKDEAGGNRVAVHDGETVSFDAQRTIEELRGSMKDLEIDAWPRAEREITSLNLEPDRRGDAIPGRTLRDKVLYIAPNPELRETINALMRKIYNNHLSGLHNRRWLDDNLSEVLDFFTEIHAIDIDKFGDVNKRVGEDEADRALRVLGKLLHEETRGEPALAPHLSGEEFFLLTRMGPDRARRFAHRVRRRVEEKLGRESNLRDRESGERVDPTISVGIAPIERSADLAPAALRDRILEHSEQALKSSKTRGRNWVSVFAVPPTALDRAVEAVSSLRDRSSRIPLVGPGLSSLLQRLGEALRSLSVR